MRRVLVRDLEAAHIARCPRCGADLLRQPDATLACEPCDAAARDRVALRVLAREPRACDAHGAATAACLTRDIR